MNKIYKKWWFWVIVILVIGVIAGGQAKKNNNSSPYITKYEWNLADTKTFEMDFDGETVTTPYVLLEVENKDGDLQAGEYNVKSNDSKSTFLLNITDKTFADLNNLPYPDEMIQGSEKTIKLEKGQYLYIVKGTTGSESGKIILEKK